MAKNVIIGQSGGPTAVINSSLAGVYKAAISLGAEKVYGMQYGIEGLLKEEMLELNVLLNDRMSIELLKRTPSSYLGSCRYKLPDPDVDATPFVKLSSPCLTSTTSVRCSTSVATTRWTPSPSSAATAHR